jgi:DNA-binding beta-propeller fold protein YncE
LKQEKCVNKDLKPCIQSQLFGVDTLAIDLTGRYLYVSNMTLSGAMNQLQVLDVKTGTVVKTITFDDVVVGGLPETALPTGLFIR